MWRQSRGTDPATLNEWKAQLLKTTDHYNSKDIYSVDTFCLRLHPTQTCIFQSDIHYTCTRTPHTHVRMRTHTLSHIPWIQNLVKVKIKCAVSHNKSKTYKVSKTKIQFRIPYKYLFTVKWITLIQLFCNPLQSENRQNQLFWECRYSWPEAST